MPRARARLLLWLFTATTGADGCATVLSSPTQVMRVETEPPGARVTVDGAGAVRGGGEIRLSRDRPHFIDVAADGYASQRILVRQTLNPRFFANFALLPLFWAGMVVDAISGAINELEPSAGVATVRLSPRDQPALTPLLGWVVRVHSAGGARPTALTEALVARLRTALEREGAEVDAPPGAEPQRERSAATHEILAGVVRFGSACESRGTLLDLRHTFTASAASAAPTASAGANGAPRPPALPPGVAVSNAITATISTPCAEADLERASEAIMAALVTRSPARAQ